MAPILFYTHLMGGMFMALVGFFQACYVFSRYFKGTAFSIDRIGLCLPWRGRYLSAEGIAIIVFCVVNWIYQTAASISAGVFTLMDIFHLSLPAVFFLVGLSDIGALYRWVPRRTDFVIRVLVAFLVGFLMIHHYDTPEVFGGHSPDHGAGHLNHSSHHGHGSHHVNTPLLIQVHDYLATMVIAIGVLLLGELHCDCRSLLMSLARSGSAVASGIWLLCTAFLLYPSASSAIDPYSSDSLSLATIMFALSIVGAALFTGFVGFALKRCLAPNVAFGEIEEGNSFKGFSK